MVKKSAKSRWGVEKYHENHGEITALNILRSM